MPKMSVEKVLIIGTGPMITGHAAEFDFSAVQACRVFHGEGIRTVLLNSNPATLLTESGYIDKLYIERLTIDKLKTVIELEKPDALYAAAGGQVALNLALQLEAEGYLKANRITLLGINADALSISEGGDEFIQAMESFGLPLGQCNVAKSPEEAGAFFGRHSLPLSIRPVYPYASVNNRVALNAEQAREYARLCILESAAGKCYMETSPPDCKTVQYDVLCDDNSCVAVCTMEDVFSIGYNMDDSIVVSPALTLKREHDMFLKSAAKKVARALGIRGLCSIRFSIKRDGSAYNISRILPWLTRSCAFASKATGYHIPRISMLLALGYKLEEISTSLDSGGNAGLEPLYDYVAMRFPWNTVDDVPAKNVSGRPVAGETMSIGVSFEQALHKGIRSPAAKILSLVHPSSGGMDAASLRAAIEARTNQSIYHAAEALRRGFAAEEVSELSGADIWYIHRMRGVIELEAELAEMPFDRDLLIRAKDIGLPDSRIAQLWNADEQRVREVRHEQGILPVYNTLDTYAAHNKSSSTYLYSVYSQYREDAENRYEGDKQKVVVIGPGPIRFNEGMEYEFSTMQCIKTIQDMGYSSVIINCDTETATSDYDAADRVYLEPMVMEDVLAVLDREGPVGVIIQFGGRVATRLASSITEAGYRILGTSMKDMDNAGDRKELDAMVDRARLPRPETRIAMTPEQALTDAEELGYPVLFGVSDDNMDSLETVYTPQEITDYVKAVSEKPEFLGQSFTVCQYISGKEIEVDAVHDGDDTLIAGIMEHIERIGLNTNDSICVYPLQHTAGAVLEKVHEYTKSLAQMLNIRGLFNVKYIICEDEVYVKEIKPSSSQTAPYLEAITGAPVTEQAVRVCLGDKLDKSKYTALLEKGPNMVAITVPSFICRKRAATEKEEYETLPNGSVLGVHKDYPLALLKGMHSSGTKLPRAKGGRVLLTVDDGDKGIVLPIAEKLVGMGYDLFGTKGTAHYLNRNYLGCETVRRMEEDAPNIRQLMQEGVDLIIYTPTRGDISRNQENELKKLALAHGIMCITNMQIAEVLVDAIKNFDPSSIEPAAVDKD